MSVSCLPHEDLVYAQGYLCVGSYFDIYIENRYQMLNRRKERRSITQVKINFSTIPPSFRAPFVRPVGTLIMPLRRQLPSNLTWVPFYIHFLLQWAD